jgi:hypothetical protein
MTSNREIKDVLWSYSLVVRAECEHCHEMTDYRIPLGSWDGPGLRIVPDLPECVLADDGVTCARTDTEHRMRLHGGLPKR